MNELRQFLVRFGERRQAHDLPFLLRQLARGQIVPRVAPEGRALAQRLHASNDGSELVVVSA